MTDQNNNINCVYVKTDHSKGHHRVCAQKGQMVKNIRGETRVVKAAQTLTGANSTVKQVLMPSHFPT